MLSFREIDYNKDLDQILDLIKKNLDPDFSLELFKWKHLENPFGKSYGLLALDEDRIVGLRMFMLWKFQKIGEKELLNAIRPVDTVVDTAYRGQGLFKRLTLTGLEECRKAYDYDLIFNTPNGNSLPGYLKMGWEKYNYINCFKVGMLNPLYGCSSFKDLKPDEVKLEGKRSCQKKNLKTYTPLMYYKWRYQDSSFRVAYFKKEQIYVVYRKSKLYIIVYEIVGNSELTIQMLNALGRKFKKALIYFYEGSHFEKVNFLFKLGRNKPNITLRNFEVVKHKDINFSLADLDASF